MSARQPLTARTRYAILSFATRLASAKSVSTDKPDGVANLSPDSLYFLVVRDLGNETKRNTDERIQDYPEDSRRACFVR